MRLPGGWLGVKIAWKKREGYKVTGVGNRLGAYFVPFFDYDCDRLSWVMGEIHDLQDRFSLGDAYIFKTTKGYHVIMLDLLKYDDWIRVLSSSSCDPAFQTIAQKNHKKVWILRFTPKGENTVDYLGVLHRRDGVRSPRRTSYPHIVHLLKRGVPREQLEPNIFNCAKVNESLIFANYEA